MLPVLLALLVVAPPPDTSWPHQDLRERMVQQQIAARGLTDPAVRGALRSVPRHRFVPEVSPELAYADRPLPIGHDQTISQPYIVARMTALVRPDSADRVLEVGTGSGYQAAVLASIVDSVYTIEIIPDLAASATKRLRRLGYRNVVVRNGDGFDGWPHDCAGGPGGRPAGPHPRHERRRQTYETDARARPVRALPPPRALMRIGARSPPVLLRAPPLFFFLHTSLSLFVGARVTYLGRAFPCRFLSPLYAPLRRRRAPPRRPRSGARDGHVRVVGASSFLTAHAVFSLSSFFTPTPPCPPAPPTGPTSTPTSGPP
ncbi:protein-L-isoaspartate O-methyltransferase family protein [Salinibacter ruber]|uniref:protein-L-isoaspartate O-methyltransferase family protein n=1 Tax=Salinibacter ruber TaxID=146919 RepID=UPI001F0723C4|nr:protein-L-isoaspartate O-methyltransferase [Salinibacter ruber]MCS3705281.1 hypothetical protein [Salinibacter ruber]MCS3854151.1 hypothetical protein [Salinibacter ruber]MCS4135765.1 hypothetical protein [Salinibacter ruber]MCS4220800.1 hypothetical protein [Salinibacter ruber]